MNLFTQLENIATIASHNAAIACYDQIGKGDKHKADLLATQSMRHSLNNSNIKGTIVIGEGEMDEAPMLFINEIVGFGSIEVDIAVDPLEGTTLCSKAMNNAMTTIAIAEKNSILHAPDMYMQKLASCKVKESGIIDLSFSLEKNIQNLSKYLNKDVKNLGICILDRPRHKDLVNSLRSIGVKIFLISDGDIAGILQTYFNENTDLYLGSGGAPEGILSAAAIKTMNGFMQGSLVFENDEQISRAQNMGIVDIKKIYNLNDMISGDVIFSATGVTDGFLQGVKKLNSSSFKTETLLTNSRNKTIKKIEMIQNV